MSTNRYSGMNRRDWIRRHRFPPPSTLGIDLLNLTIELNLTRISNEDVVPLQEAVIIILYSDARGQFWNPSSLGGRGEDMRGGRTEGKGP